MYAQGGILTNEQRVQQLAENKTCAECGASVVEYVSYNVGVFLCSECASFHGRVGTHISKVKHLYFSKWDDEHVKILQEAGNKQVSAVYEQFVPICYRRPDADSPGIVKEQWIRAKYERQEFMKQERQVYLTGQMEGYLKKKAKHNNRYLPRKFVLSEIEDTLKYYVKEHKDPKAVLRISSVNVTFVAQRAGINNAMELSFMKDGRTRHIYLYHDSGEETMTWYLAIRNAKINRMLIAYPSTQATEVAPNIMTDFTFEGWLWKTPGNGEPYRRRFFILENRKLMYHEQPLDPFARGEIFVGYQLQGYAVNCGLPDGIQERAWTFTLHTPERSFYLSAESEPERDQWMLHLKKVILRSVTLQETVLAANLRKPGMGSTFSLLKGK